MSRWGWGYVACLPVVVLLVAGSARLLLSESPSEPTSEPIIDPEMAEQLRALGYADWVAVGDDASLVQGVTLNESELTYNGYNLYNSRWRDRAYLIDMEGNVAHSWFSPGLGGNWHHIEMLPSGDLFAIYKDGYLAKMDWAWAGGLMFKK